MFRSKKKYIAARPHRRRARRALLFMVMLGCVLAAGAVVGYQKYTVYLRPVSQSNQVSSVTISSGMSTQDIAGLLKADGLIRNTTVFEWYVSIHRARSDLQAGTYALQPSMSLPMIVSALTKGQIVTHLMTILPGQRLDQVRTVFIRAGFAPAAVDAALDPASYSAAVYPVLASKPAGASLEGFLFPDSFQKNATTSPQQIIEESLTEMDRHLTPDIRAAFAREGLSVYQGVTLASMVEQEVPGNADRAQVAQVFLARLKAGMSLGSDVTAFYGAIQAGVKLSTTYDSPYNTLLHKGLPAGPISSISDSSLQAVAHPANTEWLYFVTGDNGQTYFAKTAQAHDQQTAQYCHKLCSSTP